MVDVDVGNNISSKTPPADHQAVAINSRVSYRYQYAVTAIVTVLIFSGGMALGWSSPSIPKLLHDVNNPVRITEDESSWVVSLMELGIAAAALPSVLLMDKFGRANALRIGAVPIAVGWILISVADNVAYLYVARFLCGFTFGLCLCVMPMYLGEIASPQIRGRITIALTLLSKIGLLTSFSVGPFVSFRVLAYVCVLPPIVFLAATLWLPESPYYLLGANRWDAARTSLGKLRGMTTDDAAVEHELQAIHLAVQRSRENRGTFSDLWYTHGHRRALFIILALAAIQVLCGSQAILAYSQTIFGKMDVGLQPSQVSIVLATVQLVSVLVCTLIVDRVGRRPLLLFSIWGTTVCNCVVTVYFVLERRHGVDMSAWSWLSIAALMCFIVCYSMGLPSVNLAMLGEIFPTNLKAIASLVYTLTTALLAFAINKLFQVVSDRAGDDVAFGAFAGCGLVFSVGMWFLIPETKGKRFEVILEELEGSARKKNRQFSE